jgi:cobalt/nickel transport system permease protein
LDPRVKILASLFFILTTVILPERAWLSQGILFGMLILLSITAQLGPFYTVRRAFVALPFILAALPIPFLTPGPVQWVVPGLGWIVTSTGLIRFLTILVRTWIAVQAGILLSATTEVSDLLWGLKALRAPRLIVSIVGFMVRYLFILFDEALRMLRARASRSPKMPGVKRPGLVWQGRMVGMMVGSLFLRSLDRSERVHAAMVSRGYDGEMRILHQPTMRLLDWIVLIAVLSFLLSVLSQSLWS